MNRFLLIFLVSISAYANEQKSWPARHAEGWAWYHDFEKQTPIERNEVIKKTPLEEITLAKQELETALAVAMLNPTKDNVLVYMSLQKKWIEQSTYFSRLWQINVLEHPELAYLTPTTQYGVQVKKEVEEKSRQAFLKKLGNTHVLLFFFEGNNPFSQAFAEVVTLFSQQHHWSVKPVSVDGMLLKEFPQSLRDNSVAQEMNIHFFPALLSVDMSSLKATPLAFGLVTVRQIEDNILMQFEEKND